ncbi:MAG: 16S rRNA (guanine(527)-N(7))-methyltransferase RsmG [Thermodesulfobacteriota bacterium]
MDRSFLHTLSEGAAAVGAPLGKAELDLFALYHRELLLWNRRINLVSQQTSGQIALRHFVDSLTPLTRIEKPDGLLIDLGSGAGFPGIPLRIALPGLRLTLVESSRKKASFLAHIVRTLGLEQVTIIRERIEALFGEPICAGAFDTALSRAAFKLPELLRMASFFLKPGGLLIAMKGPEPAEEMDEATAVLKTAGMIQEDCRDIYLPGTDSKRKIISYRRISV